MEPKNSFGFEDIAVIGMACRFPQANSTEEYWNILKNGVNTTSSPPPNRRLLTPLDSNIKANFLKCAVDEFDASFFGISPNEAAFTDPQGRLLLEVSWEALEDACINPETLRGSNTGVFYGSWLQNYKDLLNMETGCEHNFFRKYLGNEFPCTAAKLSYTYGLKGPNVAAESACSSSMMAVHFACNSINRGECPLAIVGGANVILQWNDFMVLSQDGKCKTFDADTDGYGRAEGICVLVLKKLSQVVLDGDQIHCVIKGSFASQEGLTKSFGTPTVECEALAMKGALEAAKVCPSQIDYVEAHAAGTQIGDPLEVAAIVEAYTSSIKRDTPLFIGSGKTNIGHTEPCSGIAGIIKVILSMKNEMIPPHINLQNLNPKINFESIPGKIPDKVVPWKSNPSRPRLAGVSSFGLSGTNAHMIIQEPPEVLTQNEGEGNDKIPSQIITLSAKTETALNDATELLKEHLSQTPDNLEDIAFTANACRAHHSLRRVILGAAKNEMVDEISSKNWISGNNSHSKHNRICFTFPGIVGGSFNPEPIHILYETCSIFRLNMDKCNTIAEKVTGISLLPITSKKTGRNGIMERKPMFLSTIAFPYSLYKVWEFWGITPDVVMGHCVGELVTAVCAGVITLETAFGILNEVLLKQLETNKNDNSSRILMAINRDVETTSVLIKDFEDLNGGGNQHFQITGDNSKRQTVVVGKTDGMLKFKTFCIENGLRCKDLPNEGGLLSQFHSQEIEPTLNRCKETRAWKVPHHQPPRIRYISSVTGGQVEAFNKDYWYNCFRNRVQFTSACEVAKNLGCNIFIELGQGQTLAKLITENIGNDPRFLSSSSTSGNGCREELLRSLGFLYGAGYQIKWNSFYENATKKKVSLPHYPFQRKSFWFERKKIANNWKRDHDSISKPQIRQHPLLGNCLDFGVAVPIGTEVYENQLCVKNVTYLADHMVGNKVIFPGAGFIEMILNAGKLSLGPKNDENHQWFCINNFTISSPLLLNNDSMSVAQTTVDKGSSKISIFSKNELRKETNWKLHASGSFALENPETLTFDLKTKLQELELNAEKSATFYEEMTNIGLQYGPHFHSLKNTRQGNGETLAEAVFPEHSDKYLLHPILLDAMLQCYSLHSMPNFKKLYVPVRISKLFVSPSAFSNLQLGEKRTVFIHCKTDEEMQITLFDSNGSLLCRIFSPELVSTSVEAIIRSGEGELGETEKHTDCYQLSWKKCPRYKASETKNYFDKTETINGKLNTVQNFNITLPADLQLDTDVNRLCTYYVVNALYEMGWKIGESLIVSVDQLIQDLKIIPSLTRAFKHYLTFLVEFEFLIPAQEIGEGVYLIQKEIFLPKEQVDAEIKSLCEKLADYKCLPVIQTCGINMAAALRGTISPHYILFGERENGSTLATIFYRELRCFKPNITAMTTMLTNILLNSQSSHHYYQEKRTLRILEVGAGTGTFTTVALETIEAAAAMDFEYYFTDISSSFCSKGEKRFEKYKNNFTFTTFDLEKDGLKQGIPPQYFDLIIAADVLHATRNLRKTLSNLRVHLREGGKLFLSETNVPIKEIDISFGLLGSYWLYEDLDIRRSHCVIPTSTWTTLLKETGFCPKSIAQAECSNGHKSVMSATKADDVIVSKAETLLAEENVWAILHDGNEKDLRHLSNIFEDTKRKVVSSSLKNYKENSMRGVEEILENVKHNLEGILYVVTNTFKREETQQNIIDPLLNLLQFIRQSSFKILPKLILVTENVWFTGHENEVTRLSPTASALWGVLRKARLEIPRLKSKSIDLESNIYEATSLSKYCEQLRREMWIDDKESEVAYRQLTRFVRRLEMVEQKNKNLPEEVMIEKPLLFNDKSSFLFTIGEMETIALAVAQWMVKEGAKFIVLVGRSPPTQEVVKVINQLEGQGVHIFWQETDIADYARCEQMLARIKNDDTFPPLRGIHFCNGISDLALQSKLSGVWNLQTLTQDSPLEFFVTHSSQDFEQSNHHEINAYLESIINMRHSLKLPGTNITWDQSQWEQVFPKELDTTEITESVNPISNGISTLSKIMRENANAVIVGNVDLSWFAKRYPDYTTTLFENIAFKQSGFESAKDGLKTGIQHDAGNSRKVLCELIVAIKNEEDNKENHVEAVEKFIASIAREILGLQEEDELNYSLNFQEMGMDSLMTIDFANRVQSELGDGAKLGFLDMDELGTVEKISNHVIALFSGEAMK